MDLLRAALGAGVTLLMLVAPQLGLPFMEVVPLPDIPGMGAQEGKRTIASVEVEVGDPVALQTLDAAGNRSAVRVLWVEGEQGKLDSKAQGQGKVRAMRFAVAAPGALALGPEPLALRPGDEVAIDTFQGKWAYAPDGMVGWLRMEGTVLSARLVDKGLAKLHTDEKSLAPGWALGAEPLKANVTVRQGRTVFVSTEADAGGEPARHLRARDVRINGERVEGTRWGEGALDSVTFVAAAPAVLRGEGSDREVKENQQVQVVDFIGAYVVFHAGNGEDRVALEGFAAAVRLAEPGAAPPAGSGKAPVASFEFSPARPSTGQAVRFSDRSSDPDGRVVARQWDFGDGNTSSDPSPSHAWAQDGAFRVTLVVTDNGLLSASVTRVVTVLNSLPLAAWDANPLQPSIKDTVQFVDASRDGDGRVVAWAWDFGDGSTSTQQHPLHQFRAKGSFNVSLTVRDDDGGAAVSARTLEVRNLAPNAAFTYGPASPLAGEAVRFRDQSHDHDGTIAGWLWDFGDGATSTEESPVHAFLRQGLSKVRLTVRDEDGAHSSHDQVVDVRNAPPVADFRVSPDPPAEGQPAQFADLSSDPDGRVVERTWSFGDGALSRDPNPTHTYLRGGNVSVTLTVRDDQGAKSTAMRTLEINRRPLASFAFAPVQPSTQGPVQFTDTSLDPDGRVVAWAWSFGDGATSGERHPAHAYARAGAYAVNLTVTDERGAQGLHRHVLNVTGLGPSANFSWLPAKPTVNDTVVFQDLSTDPDGNVASRTWNFPDGTQQSGPSASKRFPVPGLHPVSLTVTDAEGHRDTAVRTVHVNLPPVAAFSWSPAAASTGQTVRFTDASVDQDGSVVAWAWSFGDGATSAERSPSHTYAHAGLYPVQLAVTDDGGAVARLTRQVPVGSVAPAAAFSVSPEAPRAGEPVQFLDASTDPDGGVVAWAWRFGDGAGSAQQNPTHTYPSSGTYAVELKVTDAAGKVGVAQRALRVAGAEALPVVFRVTYPDGSPLDLTRPGVQVALRDNASGAELAKGLPGRELGVGPDGVARGTLPALQWAALDPVRLQVAIPALGLASERTLALPTGGDLGTLVLAMPLTGAIALVPSASGAPVPERTYTDPTERVSGWARVTWLDGTPVRGLQVRVDFVWEQLAWNARPVALASHHPITDADGRAAFQVPFAAGFEEGPGSYLPGQYRIRAQSSDMVAHGVAAWAREVTLLQDPLGARSALRTG